MKQQTAILRVSAKLKRSSTPYLHKGQTVYIYLDHHNGRVEVDITPQFIKPFDVKREDIEPVRRFGSSISRVPKPLKSEQISDKDDLNAFYDAMASLMPFECQECGRPLYAYTKKAQRTVCAHLLPKAQFESIKTHPLNIMYLGDDLVAGICNHHSEWDRLGKDHRRTMWIYPEAVERFKTLATFLTDKELPAACDYLSLDWRDYV